MSNTAPKISEIFHYAADNCLWNGIGEWDFNGMIFSCDAIDCATRFMMPYKASNIENTIKEGLWNLGLSTSSVDAFNNIPFGEQRQSARYAWLKFCAMMAEEQGV